MANASSNVNPNDELKAALARDDCDLNPQARRIIEMLHDVIVNQAHEIASLNNELVQINKEVACKTNVINGLKERTLTLERYSRKTCLIFTNVAVNPDPKQNMISIIKNCLQSPIHENIVACHHLNKSLYGPVVVMFL